MISERRASLFVRVPSEPKLTLSFPLVASRTVEAIPIGTRISAAFLQSAAVRAAGFAIVPLNSLAPAVKVLYALMMYVSVYPIAMSVRSTNVYEERSLGLFEEEDDSDDGEDAYQKDAAESKVAGWTRYLAFHARRQLAFDMWWLGAYIVASVLDLSVHPN